MKPAHPTIMTPQTAGNSPVGRGITVPGLDLVGLMIHVCRDIEFMVQYSGKSKSSLLANNKI